MHVDPALIGAVISAFAAALYGAVRLGAQIEKRRTSDRPPATPKVTAPPMPKQLHGLAIPADEPSAPGFRSPDWSEFDGLLNKLVTSNGLASKEDVASVRAEVREVRKEIKDEIDDLAEQVGGISRNLAELTGEFRAYRRSESSSR